MKNDDDGIGRRRITGGPFLVTGNGLFVDDLTSDFDAVSRIKDTHSAGLM